MNTLNNQQIKIQQILTLLTPQTSKQKLTNKQTNSKTISSNPAAVTVYLLLSLLLFLSPPVSATPLKNQMQGQHNQYLAMHGKDPVHWQLWGQDALKLAQKLNRPILISSGYYACHWCHVMQKENYQNPKTADYLNQHFISVKIDRELNPEIDQVMIDFSKQHTGQAGWPQHVILTPQGYPFAAFIYLTNEELNRYLQRITSLWQGNQEQVIRLAKQAADKLNPTAATNTAFDSTQFTSKLFNAINQKKDDLSGGLKSTAKFPKAPILNALLTQPNLPEEIEEWLITSLDLMQSEHLIDHVHGGFYRYTIDPEWQIPHFEKMAYNSALLAESYLLAGQRFQRADYLQTARETLNYLRKHLFNKELGLYQSSQSAIDKNDIEGGDYLWSKQHLQKTLSPKEYQLVAEAWQLNQASPYEQGWHPKPIQHPEWDQIKNKLKTDVQQIPKDTKSILSWNGLVLNSLSLAANILADPDYRQQASALASKLSKKILSKQPPRTLSQTGTPSGSANIEDFAYILNGLNQYQKQTGDQGFATQIKQLENKTKNLFYQNNHWQFDATPLLPSMQSNKLIKDGPLPSPIGSVHCLVEGSLNSYYADMIANPIDYASLLSSLNCNNVK